MLYFSGTILVTKEASPLRGNMNKYMDTLLNPVFFPVSPLMTLTPYWTVWVQSSKNTKKMSVFSWLATQQNI